MPVIDADTHIFETEETWDHLEGKDRQYRPKVLVLHSDSAPGRRGGEFWLIDGHLSPKGRDVVRSRTSLEAAEMRDIPLRLRHMDELGTDIHVIFPTTLLGVAALARPQTQVALCHAYNRWMAGCWKRGNGRIRWVATLPFETMDVALEELQFARENGGCGVLMHGLLADRTPVDPYYFPVYEAAQDANLPICIHSGLRNHAFSGMFHSRANSLWMAKVPVITALHSLVVTGIPQQFPRLRWGFLEASASWVPYALTDLGARFARLERKETPMDVLRSNRLYVACQTEDDLPYILKLAGEDSIVIGTDYSHTDLSSELEAIQIVQKRPDLSAEAKQKIVDDNARALYGL